jgi:hypothetical protein
MGATLTLAVRGARDLFDNMSAFRAEAALGRNVG